MTTLRAKQFHACLDRENFKFARKWFAALLIWSLIGDAALAQVSPDEHAKHNPLDLRMEPAPKVVRRVAVAGRWEEAKAAA